MEKKDILIWSVWLMSIVISTIPAIAQDNKQNNNEKKGPISSPKISSQLPDSKLLPETTTSFPASSTELFNPNPFLSSYSSLFRFNPVLWNYNLSDTTKWATRLLFIPFNRQTTLLGLGEYNNIGVSLLWNSANKLSFETSTYLSKQFGYVFPSRQILYGMDLMLNYAITDKLIFRSWGRYITPSFSDPFLNMNNLSPKTNIGADLQYKTTRKTEIGVGIEYQYDNKTSTWKPESGGKMKIGF
ncbi:MAG: hypothetical protein PHG27_06085 [Massilibacteroides sp.]|nr:hypothetical protein [Massilibacteroides sp.]MDD3061872.1 hypothetical protein [Massilibacteroides sp.]MDD4115150.1 hypothetical protein [Massilibacteroides sp.]MDD4661251.1 hypothetical protein [Massilibacteroides sp.]